jgi:hypothetical protein
MSASCHVIIVDWLVLLLISMYAKYYWARVNLRGWMQVRS